MTGSRIRISIRYKGVSDYHSAINLQPEQSGKFSSRPLTGSILPIQHFVYPVLSSRRKNKLTSSSGLTLFGFERVTIHPSKPSPLRSTMHPTSYEGGGPDGVTLLSLPSLLPNLLFSVPLPLLGVCALAASTATNALLTLTLPDPTFTTCSPPLP